MTSQEDQGILQIIRKRSSVRAFTPQPVERDKLEYVMEAARLSPSAVNFQPWCILVLREEDSRSQIQSCYERDWFKTAPVYLLLCGDHSQSWIRKSDGKDHCDMDVAIAAEHICLAAACLGLGTCWVCNFDTKKCRELFNLPENIEPEVIIPIGYPTDTDVFVETTKKRKALIDIVKWEKF